jgi:hypothetical protein
MGVLRPSKWRKKKKQARADCVGPSDVTFRGRIGSSNRAFRPVNGLCHADSTMPILSIWVPPPCFDTGFHPLGLIHPVHSQVSSTRSTDPCLGRRAYWIHEIILGTYHPTLLTGPDWAPEAIGASPENGPDYPGLSCTSRHYVPDEARVSRRAGPMLIGGREKKKGRHWRILSDRHGYPLVVIKQLTCDDLERWFA